MNLKKQFYKDYYIGIDLKKVVAEQPQSREENKDHPFKAANEALTGYQLKSAARDYLDFAKQVPAAAENLKAVSLTTIYPGLFTGSGYTHETGNVGELKLGFFFDHTTGLPILPGSSVKGTIRSAFPQFRPDDGDPLKPAPSSLSDTVKKGKADFIAALFSIPQGDYELVHLLELAIFEGVDYPATIAARAGSPGKVAYLPMRLRDIFLDAFIKEGDANSKILGTDSITPHGDNPLKNPIPLAFLKVLPNVTFQFQFVLQPSVLKEDFIVDAQLKRDAFEQILATFGVGAKTNVGYGQFVNPVVVPEDGIVTRPRIMKEEPDNYTGGRPRVNTTKLEAKVIVQGKPFSKVEVIVNNERYIVEKATGNFPEAGVVCRVTVKEISSKTNKITMVSYDGIL